MGTGIRELPKDAFCQCSNLTTIEIPEQVKEIGECAFSGSGLESIKLHEGLEIIENDVFDCVPMIEIEIPSSVERLNYCFRDIKTVVLKKYTEIIAYRMTCVTSRNDKRQLQERTLKCNGKEIVFPKYVTLESREELKRRMDNFFTEGNTEIYCSTFDCANNAYNKRMAALSEYKRYKNEEAKAYLKKNAKAVIFDILVEYEESDVVEFLKLGFVSKITLKKVMEKADEMGKITVKAYVMQLLDKKRNKFSL